MMRKNNNNRNNNMKHRNNNGGGQRRFQSNGGGNRSSGGNDAGNIARQKHHATQQLGKYSDMARNAQINGDRVDVEYYLQHVDHYTRVLTDIAAIEAERFAHHREQQVAAGHGQEQGAHGDNAGQSESPQASDHQSGSTDSAEAPAENAAVAAPAEAPRAPRPRQQRRPYNPPQGSDNGAAEANSNTTEIPLPGGILPPV